MTDIDIPRGWKGYTARKHPESTDLVDTVAWFKNESDAEVVIWEGQITDLDENERFQVEVRSPDGEILDTSGFEETEKEKAYSFAQDQMEMYPVQEVIKEE